jgi:hypothetical protein
MVHKTVKKIRNSRLIRITILLTMLTVASCSLINQVIYNMSHAYAVTYSLGHGYGFIFYTPKYYELPPILQESVRVHEDRHLEQGSCAFWRHNELEVDAYQFQINKLDERLIQLAELWRKTRNYEVKKDIELLLEFRRDMIHSMRVYQGLEKDEGD